MKRRLFILLLITLSNNTNNSATCESADSLALFPETLPSASLELMVENRPDDPSLRLRLARAYMQEKDLSSAVRTSLDLVKNNADCAEAHLYLAKSLRLLRGNTERCLHHAREAARLNDAFPYQKELLSALYFLKHYDEAGRLAETLAERHDDPSISYNSAVILMRMGERDKMRQTLRTIIAEHEDFVPALTLLASDRIDYGDYEAASGYVERALKADPENVLSRYLKGRIAQKQGDIQEARRSYEFVIDRDPFHHHALFQLARTYSVLGLDDQAKNARRSLEAVKALPEHVRENYQLYLQTHPDTVETHWKMGTVYLEIQRGNLAAREFERVLELNPTHQDALFTLGGIYTASEEFETALSYLDRALDCHPNRQAVQYARAVALIGLNEKRKARAALREVLSLNPDHEKAKELLGKL